MQLLADLLQRGAAPSADGATNAAKPREAIPADLARVVRAWDRMTETDRAAVLAVVERAGAR